MSNDNGQVNPFTNEQIVELAKAGVTDTVSFRCEGGLRMFSAAAAMPSRAGPVAASSASPASVNISLRGRRLNSGVPR